MDCVHYWEVGPWGGGGAPTGLIAPGATHPRYATDYEVAEIFGTAYSRVANIDKGISGFKASGIFPFDSEKFSQEDFATLPVSSD
jgi:hypothetical protein